MMPHAAKKGDLEMVKHLIQRGMWVNIGDHYCRTALHRAAQLGHYEIVKYLISCKSELNFKDRAGNTPVLLAGDAGKKDVVDFLLKCGARANCANGDKCTLLHFAAGNGWEDVEQEQEVVDFLLECGARVNCTNDDKCTLLHFATGNGWTDVVGRLLKYEEIDLNATNQEGESALMWAARDGRKDVIAILLRVGADVLGKRRLDLNLQDRFGRTPLHRACYKGHLAVLRQLLESFIGMAPTVDDP
ncbi:hypothetical protein JTE90_006982 [Oedothorax gibbosus]|uniref:Uncharacterized protein n=1 Tax=Oedothorax gibbosus TaxID=931172 RepID=A0AAV6VBY1_9ARAC|nr:hypothetical protein JTE90_006982 [Oedothorax gibbosus]